MQFQSNECEAPPAAAALRVQVCDGGDPGRAEVAAFIRARFASRYGARVRRQMPRLLALRDPAGSLIAAVGLRTAGPQPLFLEHYLNAPVEQYIHARAGAGVGRATIVEIGNLALAAAGHARTVIVALTAYLCGAGLDWVVFTAVTSLRNSFARMGLEPIELAGADPGRLGSRAADWGRYYESRPLVYAGNVRHGAARLQTCLRQPDAASRWRLWMDAYVAGMCRP